MGVVLHIHALGMDDQQVIGLQGVSQCDGEKGGGEHDGLGSIEGVAGHDEQGLQGVVNVMVIREEVYMMGLAVLRVWLVMMNRGYRGLVNVMVTREG
jgi:hypothetical protein